MFFVSGPMWEHQNISEACLEARRKGKSVPGAMLLGLLLLKPVLATLRRISSEGSLAAPPQINPALFRLLRIGKLARALRMLPVTNAPPGAMGEVFECRSLDTQTLQARSLKALSPSLEPWTELQKKSRERDEAGVPAAPCEGSLCQQALREPRFFPASVPQGSFLGGVCSFLQLRQV